MVGTMGALTAMGAKATVQGTYHMEWKEPGEMGQDSINVGTMEEAN